jgi:hypothetical protein
MANSSNQAPVTVEELLVSSLAQTDALAKLLIEKGIITEQEFLAKISEEKRRSPHFLTNNFFQKGQRGFPCHGSRFFATARATWD